MQQQAAFERSSGTEGAQVHDEQPQQALQAQTTVLFCMPAYRLALHQQHHPAGPPAGHRTHLTVPAHTNNS